MMGISQFTRGTPRIHTTTAPARPLLLSMMAALTLTLALAGCSAGSGSKLDDPPSNGGSPPGQGGTGGSGGTNQTGGTDPGIGGFTGGETVELTGTVVAPEGSIPISGALVYVTKDQPEPIPQEVYCDRCVELEDATPHTLSAPDGSFAVDVPAGFWYLVVQKGAFRRVRGLDIGGDMVAPLGHTTLPPKRDVAAGDEVPKIAVVTATWDKIENTLMKLGLDTPPSGFEVITGMGDAAGVQMLTDYTKLSQYHIVFFPCDQSWPNSHLANPQVLNNLQTYVNAGGRLYVTDYSYDILRQAFPHPIKWLEDTGAMDSAEGIHYDAPAVVNSPDMAAWLAAQGITTFTLTGNWTAIETVAPYNAPDENGEPKTLDPTVWMGGIVPNYGSRPTTVSFQYGCGRALFSTYHTTEEYSNPTLAPQELALLYITLEVAVCIGEPGGPN